MLGHVGTVSPFMMMQIDEDDDTSISVPDMQIHILANADMSIRVYFIHPQPNNTPCLHPQPNNTLRVPWVR